MNVVLKPVTRYEVLTEDGHKLGVFDQEGEEWHGMVALRSESMDMLVVEAPHFTERMLASLPGSRDRTAAVIRISAAMAKMVGGGLVPSPATDSATPAPPAPPPSGTFSDPVVESSLQNVVT